MDGDELRIVPGAMGEYLDILVKARVIMKKHGIECLRVEEEIESIRAWFGSDKGE